MRIFSLATVYLGLGAIVGSTSAMQALSGSALRAVKNGNGWQQWRLDDNDNMLPYSVGHFLSEGKLPPPKSALYYVRDRDDDGNVLRGDCAYSVEGPAIPSRWWSLSAGTNAGAVLSAGEAVLDGKKHLRAVVSRRPEPGNWIVPSDSGSYTLVYILSEASKATAVADLELPHVKKLGC
jgi:hypothetical protein